MSKITLIAAVAAVSAMSGAAPAAWAQAPKPAAPPPARVATPAPVKTAAPPPAASGAALEGPLVKGVCLLSQEAVLTNAKAAQAIDTRLKQLKTQAQSEVDGGRAPVDADLKILQADAAKTPAPAAADIEKRRVAIQARYQTLQELADQRNREIEATRAKAVGRLSVEMQPVLATAYRAHGCGLLFNRNAVMAGNMGDDLTAEVIRGLDAKITTMTFDREVLPPAQK
jgi:Skp family chaperone for outer membrane proteins